MFYDYLKSIYSIVEKHDSDSIDFKNMIAANDFLINSLNKRSTGNNMSVNQFGGSYRTIKILSLQKSKLLKDVQSGGGPVDDLNALQKSILNIIQTMNTSSGHPTIETEKYNAEIREIVQKIQTFKSTFDKLIEYIEFMHHLLPDKSNVAKLNEQLVEIKKILTKY